MNMHTKEMKTLPLPQGCTCSNKFGGANVMGSKVYFTPRGHHKFLVMDFDTLEMVEEALPEMVEEAHGLAFSGSVTVGSRMFAVPSDSDFLVEVMNCAYQLEQWGFKWTREKS